MILRLPCDRRCGFRMALNRPVALTIAMLWFWLAADRELEHDPEKWTPVFGKDHAP